MSKVTLGTSANATAAKDMVDRCRTKIMARTTLHGMPTAYGQGSGAVRGWSEELALDSASTTFEFFQCVDNWVQLRHKTEDLIYKVQIDTSATTYADEKARFDAWNTAGETWLCDYFYYDTQQVMVTRKYVLLDPQGPTVQSTHASRPAPYDARLYKTSAEYADWRGSGVNSTPRTWLGIDGAGKYRMCSYPRATG